MQTSDYPYKLYVLMPDKDGILRSGSYAKNFTRYLRTNQLHMDKVLQEEFNAIQYFGGFRFQREQDLTLFLLRFV